MAENNTTGCHQPLHWQGHTASCVTVLSFLLTQTLVLGCPGPSGTAQNVLFISASFTKILLSSQRALTGSEDYNVDVFGEEGRFSSVLLWGGWVRFWIWAGKNVQRLKNIYRWVGAVTALTARGQNTKPKWEFKVRKRKAEELKRNCLK